MEIGIVVSLDLKRRTGVEEYVYQLLKHLPMLDESKKHHFFIYSRENLKWPFKWGWTQIRLSLEMLRNSPPHQNFGGGGKPDILFVPAHTFPIIHPKLVVAIQGLEYEHLPDMYSFWQRKILKFLTKRNLKKAEKIIVPSECTKDDLIKFYKVNSEKIFVIPHGISKYEIQATRYELPDKYILYLGSGHKRKNIEGLKKAFKILKEKYPPASPAKRGGRGKIPHELILAGIKKHVEKDEKWQLIKNADVFVFPSFYEGFGFPVLEAQAVGVPVVASNVSSLPEILGDSALLINPQKPEEIAEAIYKIIRDEKLRKDLIIKGYENIKRFNWQKCARETLKVITS